MEQREQIINNYIDAYNNFDVAGMVRDFDADICFRNISNGEVNMELRGIDQFLQQAEKAKCFFLQRTQTLKSFNHKENETEIEIDYHAIFAIDIPDGPKKGEAMALSGRSIYRFDHLKIVELTDVS
jgi:hypothetical protein